MQRRNFLSKISLVTAGLLTIPNIASLSSYASIIEDSIQDGINKIIPTRITRARE